MSARDENRLAARIARLPTGPGVYLFRDADGAVAYVGKARNLRARVRSYFTGAPSDTRRAARFARRYVHDVDFVTTSTEKEAYLLENQLVKRHKPAYNVKLRDDKDFLYVRVDRRHDFPALTLARRPRGKPGDAVRYVGPYANASGLRRTLRMMGGMIPLRDCTDREFAARTRPCLKHEMQRCCAPCVGLVGKDEYAALLDEAVALLEGRAEPVLGRLERTMAAAAEEERYEQAARARDQIRYLRSVTASQKVENTGLRDADAVGFARAGDLVELVVLFFRRGALVSSASHGLSSDLPDDELLAGFLLEFYDGARPLPASVLLPSPAHEADGLAELLAERRGGPVEVTVPRRGAGRDAVDLARRNARHGLTLAVEQRGHQRVLLDALAKRLDLPAPPETIECYDVSNTGRGGALASRVVFRHGEPDPSGLRTYRIRSVEGQDDYASLAEALSRRLARRAGDPLPDLLVVDGGAAHLGVAERACAEAGVEVPLAAIAKGKRRGRALTLGAGEQERVFRPGRSEPIVLDRDSPEEYLLQRVRDEAHRVAIGRHRRARGKRSLASRLDDVPGVGPVLKRRLLTAFGGTRALARADAAEVARVPGVGPRLARTILEHLQATGD